MENNSIKKKKFNFSMPHSYIIIGIIIILVMILTYIVPAGEFDRVEDAATGRTVIIPESFHFIEKAPVSIFDMFKSISAGMVEAADIIFFVFFAYGFVYILIKSGAFDGGMGALISKISGKEKLIIPVLMLLFGIMGASFGMYEETYGFVPVVMAVTVAMGYDALVGAVIVFVGVATGFAAAITNPFTIGIAQGIVGLPMFSGIVFRIVIWVCFMTLVIWYTMRYAKKVKNDPSKSIVKDVKFSFLSDISKEELLQKEFTKRHKISLGLFALTIITLVYGTLKYGWYLEELSALFIIMMFVIGFVNKYSPSQIAEIFIDACKTVIFGALVIGISRAVLIVLQNGLIIDTIVHYLASSVSNLSGYVAGVAMIFIQNILNFFIPSGSGQAATSMPIMAPIADIIGLNRQIAVLAFQFGDGFSNLFWPTVVAVECGIAGVPLNKWYKFMGPLFVYMLILQVILMCIAVAIGYGPF